MRPLILFLLLFPLTVWGSVYGAQGVEDSLSQELRLHTGPAITPLEFEQEKMETYKTDPKFDYSEEVSRDNWWTRFKNYLNLQYQRFWSWLYGDYEAHPVLRFFIQLLPYLVILTVILLAVWVFNKMNPVASLLSEPEEAGVFLSEEEEIIKSRDIDHLIQDAVAQGNFRLAIRYYFLLILQQLTQKDLIHYEFSKTDEEYVREIKIQPLQQQFKQLTRIYDFVWYGNFEASQDHYMRSKKEFDKMQQLIQQAHE